ncbi:MAG: hypothetical protein RQ866_09015 [Bacteroidales bacterium]|nr:hypothetical protein [Bacteroidales bacterium]
MKPLSKWWKKAGKYNINDPKHHWPWVHHHKSSTVKPGKLDTTANLKNHPFWDDVLPIFDKYYTQLNTKINTNELDNDLKTITLLEGKHHAGLNDCYDKFSSKSLITNRQKIKNSVKTILKK